VGLIVTAHYLNYRFCRAHPHERRKWSQSLISLLYWLIYRGGTLSVDTIPTFIPFTSIFYFFILLQLFTLLQILAICPV
jgi:hypothetical protein